VLPHAERSFLPRLLRAVTTLLLVLAGVGLAGFVWWQRSVTPRVMVIRAIPGSDALGDDRTLTAYLPKNVTTIADVAYGSGADERLDIYYPDSTTEPLPTIVWMHGGAFIGGSKERTRSYLQILASHGYTIVNVEYSKGPGAHWPEPIRQLTAAIAHIDEHAAKYRIDPNQIVLGGDSAGAQIASQAAVTSTNPAYVQQSGLPVVLDANRIKATILFSGPFDLQNIEFNNGKWGFFLTTVLWAYTGHKDFLHTKETRWYSVTPWVTSDYPPTFISTGPHDPLLSQSVQLADVLRTNGVDVSTVFFQSTPANTAIGHEYEMALDTPEAKTGMIEMVAFLRRQVSTPNELPGVSAGWTPVPLTTAAAAAPQQAATD
jgi:acetyl esterase/lipase